MHIDLLDPHLRLMLVQQIPGRLPIRRPQQRRSIRLRGREIHTRPDRHLVHALIRQCALHDALRLAADDVDHEDEPQIGDVRIPRSRHGTASRRPARPQQIGETPQMRQVVGANVAPVQLAVRVRRTHGERHEDGAGLVLNAEFDPRSCRGPVAVVSMVDLLLDGERLPVFVPVIFHPVSEVVAPDVDPRREADGVVHHGLHPVVAVEVVVLSVVGFLGAVAPSPHVVHLVEDVIAVVNAIG